MGKYKKRAGIYLITNISNMKVYVGYSEGIKKRWSTHRNRLRRSAHKNKHLQAAWNKYNEKMFTFLIIEDLSLGLTKEQYEEVETKWVLHYKSHLREFGYNGCLPGNKPIREEGGNKTLKDERVVYNPIIVIDVQNKQFLEYSFISEVVEKHNIKYNKIFDYLNYWRGRGKMKSYKGFSFIRKGDFNPETNYFEFKKKRRCKEGPKKTWRDHYKYTKKAPEDIIPYSNRNLKRVFIKAVNINTGEEILFSTIKSTREKFIYSKVIKCINNEFGRYKHRGYYFKRAENSQK